MIRHARDAGARTHDLWGVAPETATPETPGTGRAVQEGFWRASVIWSGTWDIVVDRTLYRMRGIAERGRLVARTLPGRFRRKGR